MDNKKLNESFLGHPKPLLSLSFVELWERFSFYGIRPLLVLYMIAMVSDGGFGFDRPTASAIVGIFGGSVYLAPLFGGWLADHWLGQKKATFYGAVIIALGHLNIALSGFFGSFFFFLGLCFIVVGTGLFKTCASVLVGMLYKDGDVRRDSGFTIFYMGINLGGLVAPLLTGLFIGQPYGWHLGFGIGGLGMLVALTVFYLKTIPEFDEFNQNVGLDPQWKEPVEKKPFVGVAVSAFAVVSFAAFCLVYFGAFPVEAVKVAGAMISVIALTSAAFFAYLFFFSGLNSQEKKNLLVVLVLFIASAVFWSTFEQQATSYNLFARDFTDRNVLGFEIPVTWFQSVNPFFVILLAPVFSKIWVALAERNINLGGFGKFGLGVSLAGVGFAIMYFAVKLVLGSPDTLVSPFWLIFSLLFLTLGELCLSPVGLSMMSQYAPSSVKSQVMGLWFASSALGNVVAGIYGGHVDPEKIQDLPSLFSQLIVILVVAAVVLFVLALVTRKRKV